MADFDHRAGTSSTLGIDYENQMLAYLAVACCNHDLKDFWIASNVAGVGAFDDVILYIETNDKQKTLQLIQLKHKEDTKRNKYKITEGTSNNPNHLSLSFYKKSYEEVKSLLSNDGGTAQPKQHKSKTKALLQKNGVPFNEMQFIFLTNSSIVENISLTNIDTITFLKTVPFGPVYKIASENAENLHENSTFYTQFFIYTKQLGVIDDEMLTLVEEELHNLFQVDRQLMFYSIVAKNLTANVNKWFNSKPKKMTVNITHRLIAESVLPEFEQFRDPMKGYDELGENEWKMWQDLTNNFQIVVFENENSILLNFFDDNNSHKLMRCNDNCKEILMKCMEWCKMKKFIVYTTQKSLRYFESCSLLTFITLHDLDKQLLGSLQHCLYYFQGRKASFKSILNLGAEIQKSFTVDKIIQLLVGKLSIGKNVTKLPKYYVNQSISKVFIKESMIADIPNSFFVLIDMENLAEEYLKQNYLPKSNKLNWSFVKTPEEIDQVKVHAKTYKYIHVLKVSQVGTDFALEWLTSNGNISEIKQFTENNLSNINSNRCQTTNINLDCVQKVIISANPGMGKTVFLNYLTNSFRSDYWIILVTLHEIEFESVTNFQSLLNNYTAELHSGSDRIVFETYLQHKKLAILFDGFDEVAPDNVENSLSIIEGAITLGFKIVVSTRDVTKKLLENRFNVISHTLHPFTYDDKIQFLENFYSEEIEENVANVNEGKTQEFVKKLLEKCTFSRWDQNFTGVPLQCRMLAETFKASFVKYYKSGCLEIPRNLTLLSMYEQFIDNKFDIYWKEKVGKLQLNKKVYDILTWDQKRIFTLNHMEAAVEIIFPSADIKISNVFLEEIKNAKEKYGILTGVDHNNRAKFIHRTFAEYFAAKWLTKIKSDRNLTRHKNCLNYLLQREHNIVRDIFDKLLCKNCELHMAVLNKDTNSVKEILAKYVGEDQNKCGRSALHIATSRGARFESKEGEWERVEDEDYIEVLDMLLSNGKWNFCLDEVLGFSPQDYTYNRKAFGVVETFCKHGYSNLYNLNDFLLEKLTNEKCDEHELDANLLAILHMCAKYDYPSIATNIINLQELGKSLNEDLLKRCSIYDAHQFATTLVQHNKFTPGDLEKMKFDNEDSLLHLAAANGRVLILNLFLQFIPANITNKEMETPLFIACERNHLAVVRKLIENGADMCTATHKGITAVDRTLSFTNEGWRKDLIEYITSYEVLQTTFKQDVNKIILQKRGDSALHCASWGGNVETLERLISEGADVNSYNHRKETPLHLACRKGHLSVVRILKERGTNIFVKDIEKWTPLHWACIRADLNIARCLLESLEENVKALVINSQKELDITPLHCAVDSGNKDLVEFMIRSGADSNILGEDDCTYKQLTPLGFATQQRKRDIFLLLYNDTADKTADDIRYFYKHSADNIESRQKTFIGYPTHLSGLVDAMANAGFYYEGRGEEVTCFKCKSHIFDWSASDDPWLRHASWRPSCEFLKEQNLMHYVTM